MNYELDDKFQRGQAGRGDGSAGLPARPAALLAAGLGILSEEVPEEVPEEIHDGHQLVHLA